MTVRSGSEWEGEGVREGPLESSLAEVEEEVEAEGVSSGRMRITAVPSRGQYLAPSSLLQHQRRGKVRTDSDASSLLRRRSHPSPSPAPRSRGLVSMVMGVEGMQSGRGRDQPRRGRVDGEEGVEEPVGEGRHRGRPRFELTRGGEVER